MGEYQGAYAVMDIKYHLVWITKYQYKVLDERSRCGCVICCARWCARSGSFAERCHPTTRTP
jgi:REP element-mobilizing transposase RayT